MNRLNLDRRNQVIAALVEGNSIRSTERMTGIHRDTIMLVEVGTGCAEIMDEKMREPPCKGVQVDGIWPYVGKKQRHLKAEDDRTRVATSGRSSLSTAISSLSRATWWASALRCANIFMRDLSMRLANRIQLSSDAMDAYSDTVERSFGAEVDCGQAVKFYEAEPIGPGRYSPPKVIDMERSVITDNPDQRHISISHIERQNLTMRMSMRRFTRLTNGFSKQIENMKAAVSLHFAHYNFVRTHKTRRMTPAMAARVEKTIWPLQELVERTTH